MENDPPPDIACTLMLPSFGPSTRPAALIVAVKLIASLGWISAEEGLTANQFRPFVALVEREILTADELRLVSWMFTLVAIVPFGIPIDNGLGVMAKRALPADALTISITGIFRMAP